jgi:hypothetical protein
MKELITRSLTDAFALLERQVPQTKKQIESLSILDVKPIDLQILLGANNIPEDAWFSGRDNGYDAWDDLLLCWEIEVPTTDEDREKFKRDKFANLAFTFVYKLLTEHNYRRIPCSARSFKRFQDTTVYSMYSNKEFDRLVDYYSLFFEPDG